MEELKRSKQEQDRNTNQAKKYLEENPNGRIFQKNDEFASDYIWWLERKLDERESSYCRISEEAMKLTDQRDAMLVLLIDELHIAENLGIITKPKYIVMKNIIEEVYERSWEEIKN